MSRRCAEFQRYLRRSRITKCAECRGTGAEEPDCELCRGGMFVSIRKAIRHGWRREDLEDAGEGDCLCPQCDGDLCDQCMGDGTVGLGVNEQQETRVLIFGLVGSIPPVRWRDPYGRAREHDALLVSSAGRAVRDKGWISWFTSIFGDEVRLTPAGKVEALTRLFDWTRLRDVTLGPVDDFGRWGDDGGRAS